MTRSDEWPEMLMAFIASRARDPHAWGTNDCCSFAADSAVAMGCDDFIADMRGYSSERGAWRALRKKCYVSVAHMLDDRLPRIEPHEAQRGDVAFIPNDSRWAGAAGIVEGRFIVAPGETELLRLPLTAASSFYAVR